MPAPLPCHQLLLPQATLTFVWLTCLWETLHVFLFLLLCEGILTCQGLCWYSGTGFWNTGPVPLVRCSLPPPSPTPADPGARQDRVCMWPRCCGWKDAPSHSKLVSLPLSLALCLLYVADSGPLERKVRPSFFCSVRSRILTGASRSIPSLPTRPCFLLVTLFPPHSPHSSLTGLFSWDLYPDVYLVHPQPPAGLCLDLPMAARLPWPPV